MIQQPDQFQSRVYVHLPFSDIYLQSDAAAKKIRAELKQHIKNPLLTKQINHPIPPSLSGKSAEPAR